LASFTFYSIDLADYDLSITNSDAYVFNQALAYTQLKDYGVMGDYKRSARTIKLDIIVQGTNAADVISNLDNIKKTLVTDEDAELILDAITTRYWNARLKSLEGEFKANTAWVGEVEFLCVDPVAYSTTETDSNYNIDADPDTNIETSTGTGFAYPVFTLTAGEALADATIILENETTLESLTWEGSLEDEDVLEIDSEHFVVTVNGTESMSDVSGKFPRLQSGDNSITVTGFSTTGTLDITYRDRYV
jgi:predicted phage tail component-like protein